MEQAQLADLVAEARKVSLDLTPAQAALLPSVFAKLGDIEPLELPGLLAEAAQARDALEIELAQTSHNNW